MASIMATGSPAAVPLLLPSTVRFTERLVTALLFWAFAYVVMTLRAQFDPTSNAAVLSEARALATAAGGALLLAILLLWDQLRTRSLWLRIRVLALAIGAACAVMYAVRLFAAQELGSYGATELADGARWVIAWAGYFLAAVTTTIAWQALREAERLRATLRCARVYESADDALTP